MSYTLYQCEECESEFTIDYDPNLSDEVTYCPFCSSSSLIETTEEEDEDDDDLDQ